MKRRHSGVVVKASASKMVRVEVQRVYRHERYGKTLRRTVVCHVHDERNECKIGDRVEIVESRPMSRMKRWALIEVSALS